MAGGQHNLTLVLKALDQATQPMRAVTAKLAAMTAPAREVTAAFGHLGHAAGLPEVREGLAKVGEGLKSTVEHGKRLVETLVLGEVVGGAALFEITKRAVEAGSALKHSAERVGLTVDNFAALQFAAGQSGVKAEEFTGAMDKLNKGLGEAKARTGGLYQFLEKVSPVFAEQIRHAKGSGEALQLLAKAFQKVHDPSKQAALQAAAFGKSSKEMGAFLSQGNEKIAEAEKRYLQIAGSQEQFADQSEEAEKALNETSAAFDGLRNAAAVGLMPALVKLSEVATNFFASHRADIAAWASKAGAAISSWVDGGGIQRLIDGFDRFATGVGKVVDMLGGLSGVATIVAAYMGAGFVGSLVKTGTALAGLVPVLTATGLRLAALGTSLAPFLATAAPFLAAAGALAFLGKRIYDNWEPLKYVFSDLWKSLVADAQEAWGKMQPIVEQLTTAAQTVGEIATNPMGALKTAKEFYFGKSGQAAAPPATQAQTKVTVDFNNVPKGVRVSQDKAGDADLDLNMGFSSLVPG